MMSVLIIFFYWSAMDSHSKSEVLEIFNMTKKNFIAWFLFLKPSPIWQLLKIFSKVVRWPITWLNSTIFTGLPVHPVIKCAFGRRCQKVVSRGREDTRVWYRETMFSQMVHMSFSCTEPCTDTFCTSSALPLKNPQSVANLKKAICVVRTDSIMEVTP